MNVVGTMWRQYISDFFYPLLYRGLRSLFRGISLLFMEIYHHMYSTFTHLPIPSMDIELPPGSPYLVFICTVLLIFFYIKLKYPFWNVQPVFHTYDVWRYYTQVPFTIQKGPPLKTKFCKFENVRTLEFSELTSEQQQKCVDLLQCYYVPSERVLYTISQKQWSTCMVGLDRAPLVSFYYDNRYVLDVWESRKQAKLAGVTTYFQETALPLEENSNSHTAISTVQVPIALSCSRPITLYCQGEPLHVDAFFWDFICTHREHMKHKISRNLLQTHEYNQRVKHPDVLVSLFKKETLLCEGIVPLTQYTSYTYYLRNIAVDTLPPHFTVIRIFKENLDTLFDFLRNIREQSDTFEFISIVHISNLISMIQNQVLYVYCLKMREHVYGMYFIKDAFTHYEDIENGNTLQLIASINNSSSAELFVRGFKHALKDIQMISKKGQQKSFQMLIIENLGHNEGILTEWHRIFSPVFENPTAYYLYNMVFPGSPLSSKNVLCLM